MKEPTVGKALACAIARKRTWFLAASMWGLFFAGFAIVAVFGVLAGGKPAAAAGYLGHVAVLLTLATVVVAVACMTWHGYGCAMRKWERQRQARRTARAARRSARR